VAGKWFVYEKHRFARLRVSNHNGVVRLGIGFA
jgi:hypothetical protein